MGSNETHAGIRFGDFELQPGQRRLLVKGEPVAVGPRALDLLIVLVEGAGTLVSKDVLIKLVWPNLVVEENNLQVQVSALRKILGAEAIVTVPGYGYRFTLRATNDGSSSPAVVAAARHNLPQQVSSFVGRTQALADVRELLARARLLTLVGFGGIGKTRLALQAVRESVAAYADGVWFVELAALADARLVPQAVASVLGVKEAERPVQEALAAYVKDRHLLLILDSCEHLVQACAELAKQLLQLCPGLRILATSRERLNVGGETSYPVPPLSMPEAAPAITLEALAQYEAVHLFIERVVNVQPAFELTHDNAAALAAICRRLDGIPLAIELAAARARALSVEKIAERLSDRFRLLTRGDRVALPHRQTLRALIDWSHELLTAPERTLFRRLAVFPGTFTLEAAEAVGAGGEIAAEDVLDLLAQILDKSIVAMDATGERYRLLDTVREYAQERLDESADEQDARTGHLAFYVSFAETARSELFKPNQGAWVAKLDLERQNLLSAHAWCDRADAGAAWGLRLAYALRPYWFRSGLLALGHRLTTEAIARPGAAPRNLARCRAILDLGALCTFLGRHNDAPPYLEEGLAIAREIEDEDRVADALRILGLAKLRIGDLVAARQHFEEALDVARSLGDPFRLSEALNALAGFHGEQGDMRAARPLYEESLAIARERGDLESVAINLANLAIVAMGLAQAARAPGLLLEALGIAGQGASKWVGQFSVCYTAALAAHLGQWRSAAQLYGAAVAQLEHMGVHQDPAEDPFMTPLIGRTRDALGAAAFATAVAAGKALSYEAALAECRAFLERPSVIPESASAHPREG